MQQSSGLKINKRLNRQKIQLWAIEALRWLVSIFFFTLGITKAAMLIKYGNEPYLVVVKVAGLPEVFKYYGVLALGLELFLAVSIWSQKLYKVGILLMIGLSSAGVCLSIYSLFYKLNSECGCGLLGDNEYFLLFQKLIIITLLIILYKKSELVFTT